MFDAILIEKGDSGPHATLTTVGEDCLPLGDVTVGVVYSTLNFKDALAITGKGSVVRSFPHGARHRLGRCGGAVGQSCLSGGRQRCSERLGRR